MILASLLAALLASTNQAPEHRHQGPAHHRFEDAERWARVFDDPARDAWQRPSEVVALLGLRPGMTVVDLGAGTGYFLPHLSRAVGGEGRVLGVDIEPDMVRYMRERAERQRLTNVEARLARPDDPGLGAASVDRVLVVDTWHHVESRPAYTRRLARALRPGGQVMVVDFTLESRHGPPRAARLPAAAVAEELRAGGLEAEVVEEGLPEQYVVIARRPAR